MRTVSLPVLILAAGLVCIVPGRRAGAQSVLPALGKLAEKAPAVLELLDELTKREQPAKVKTLLKGALGEEKLVVWTTRLDVQASRTEGNWRGSVTVTMNVPARVSYHVDLSKLQASHLKYEPGKRILRVKMPPVDLGEVSAVLRDLETSNKYSGMRFSFSDGRVASRLQSSLIREDFDPQARELARGQESAARDAARTVLQRFLQRTFTAARTEVTVVVE